jgi:hypothetical protein
MEEPMPVYVIVKPKVKDPEKYKQYTLQVSTTLGVKSQKNPWTSDCKTINGIKSWQKKAFFTFFKFY